MTAEQNHGDMDRAIGKSIHQDPYFPQALEALGFGDNLWFKAFVRMSRDWRYGFKYGLE